MAGDEFIWCGWKRVHGSSGANSSLSPNEVSGNINRQRIELAANVTLNEAVLLWPNRFKGGDKYVEQHFDLAYTEPSGRLR